MPRTADFSGFTHDELFAALQHLAATRQIGARQVRAAVDRARRIAQLERQLASLRGGAVAAAGSRKPAPAPARKRRITATPALKAARKLQGRYLGRLKKLAGQERARVKALAKKDSVAAAVKLADEILAAK